MSLSRAWCVLMTCAVMAASSALHAQARAPASKAPRIEPRIEKKKEAIPCGVPGESCLASVRSRAVALSWAKGLDEHGTPLDAGARTRKLAEMDSWLRRLAGTFRIEGTYRNLGGRSQVSGSTTCSFIGAGPGLSCAITAAWKAPKESAKDPEFDKALHDAMQSLVILFGIDPDASQIRATMMDYRALQIRGFLMDDEVALSGESMETSASIPLLPYSWASSLIAVRSNGDVGMKFAVFPTSTRYLMAGMGISRGDYLPNSWIELDMRLHRVPMADTAIQPSGK